ncbi:centromere protein M isoform X2 [Cololabis saira]|uniref:centromere protein M isoform X2 n=1 Tax=Cololabis saira TaxID=129043 RepID=UPI002AD3639E|nr:centromere protein M isoform X2 [Cololabis saira]
MVNALVLVESEENFQQRLAEALVKKTSITVNVRLAKSFPLPMENNETRPRIDLVAFIINLTSELSLHSAEEARKYLDPGYFLGKVCFMVTNARNSLVPTERLDAVRKLAASLHCPLLFAEDQTPEGVNSAAGRLLTILKAASGLVPVTTALYLSNLTRCTLPPDFEQPSFD